MKVQKQHYRSLKKFPFICKRDFERSVEEVALEHLSISRILICVIEGTEKKSFPAKKNNTGGAEAGKHDRFWERSQSSSLAGAKATQNIKE